MQSPQAPQDARDLRGVLHLVTQLARPAVGELDFRGRIALDDRERRAEGELQREFLPAALGRVREGPE